MKFMQMLRTIRYLRARQIAEQIRHRVRSRWEDPATLQRLEPPDFPGITWAPAGPFIPPVYAANASDEIAAGRFTFLNETCILGSPPDWNGGAAAKLWRYNLHYFDFLWGLDFTAARTLVSHWIENHPPRRGHVGWEAYPTSLRLLNWCMVLLHRFRDLTLQDRSFCQTLWRSVFRQTSWLQSHLEYRLMGNHLLENAAALLVVGDAFDGPDANRWFQCGLGLLRRQLPEQVLPDGGHFERSPMYHCRVVYLMVMLSNLRRPLINAILEAPMARAVAAMQRMTHPDGRIALLNDSAFDICNTPSELARAANMDAAGGPGVFSLPDTGYFGSRTADGSYIICDAGPIGPDYLPGHAHGDMLSFELSLGGRRIITDSGVFDYETGRMRDYCRSTRAHNTVEIDGQDQCEFWAAFRVGSRGRVRDVNFQAGDGGFELSARHDGYRRLPARATHRRSFRWWDAGALMIKDQIDASAPVAATARLHLAPDVEAVRTSATTMLLSAGGQQIPLQVSGDGILAIEHSLYCPQFGKQTRRLVVEYRLEPARHATLTTRIGAVPQ